ncbi:hypothetical protein Mapa_004920 [Marchantia paleacea]|nr:hypothetical protein Mapa_004920 [Marchantia paleacea]
MGVPGAAAAQAPVEAMDRHKKRGKNVLMVVLFSVVLLVGMTKIHALVTFCDGESPTTGELEQEIDTRRMLTASELSAEAERRIVVEAETRRILATKKKSKSSGYYISYSALSASRVSCPPRSGRSYYTRNCNSASGAVRPYSRGCSTISRCARDSG